MKFSKINNLTGWLTGTIAFIVYLKTMEPTCSFWDCGEFLSCAYKLEGGHAPGFPTLMILQRLFALFAGVPAFTGQPSASTLGQFGAATCINALTAVMSALTILFLFWTISYFAKRIVAPDTAEPEKNQTLLILGASLVGALAYTFSDTFWFSAVEAIPFGTSPFFTAFTFWAILKWERVADNKYADRWLLLISMVIGLAVGVHLLILLVIPPIAMIVYFRRYKGTWLGGITALMVSVIVLAFIMFGIIRYIPKFASYFDILFTNSFGTPFDVGSVTFLLLLAAGLLALLIFARKKGNYILHLSTLCTIFIIIGYSTYFSAIIRARAGVPVNMTNPSNPSSFLDYVDREQFGQQPIFFGPYYNSRPSEYDTSEKLYAQTTVNGKDYYETVGTRIVPIYTGDQNHFFPRIYDGQANHANFYMNMLHLGKNDEPTMGDNLKYFVDYQLNWMWFRFFMWNYAGRQNDMEGQLDPQRGNWISGITFLDQLRGLGNTDNMGAGYSEDGHNKLYMLPFILGIMGLVFQFRNKNRDGIVVLTLFFFTGLAIAIFLNMPPLQPRERDYAFAGSTYTFAIWIGLGVLMLHQWIKKFAGDPIAASAAILLSLLAVPVLMAKEEWKDHDRSKKTLARDVAYNTLSCLAPNAVLFTFGDNQTYPLWYIQEVEGYRKDVRVINTSLLGMGWSIDELNARVNDADVVPMIWRTEDYIGDRHNFVQYYDNPVLKVQKDKYFNLIDICNFIISKEPGNMVGRTGGELTNYLPTRNFFLPALSKEELVKRDMVPAADTSRISTEMKWGYPKTTPNKSDLAILNIIAAVAKDGWNRPLYFDAGLRQGDYGGTGDYFHMEGDVYRLMPYKYTDAAKVSQPILGSMNTEKSYDLFVNKFRWGGGERNDVYFDEPNRREFITYRMDASFLANALAAEGKKDSAIKVLDKVMTCITEHSYYYDFTAYYIAAAYYRAGAPDKAKALTMKIVRNAEADVNWVTSLSEDDKMAMGDDVKQQFQIMQSLSATAYQTGDSATAKQIYSEMQTMGPKVKELLNVKGQQQGGQEEE